VERRAGGGTGPGLTPRENHVPNLEYRLQEAAQGKTAAAEELGAERASHAGTRKALDDTARALHAERASHAGTKDDLGTARQALDGSTRALAEAKAALGDSRNATADLVKENWKLKESLGGKETEIARLREQLARRDSDRGHGQAHEAQPPGREVAQSADGAPGWSQGDKLSKENEKTDHAKKERMWWPSDKVTTLISAVVVGATGSASLAHQLPNDWAGYAGYAVAVAVAVIGLGRNRRENRRKSHEDRPEG
jgi:hypothetical protein